MVHMTFMGIYEEFLWISECAGGSSGKEEIGWLFISAQNTALFHTIFIFHNWHGSQFFIAGFIVCQPFNCYSILLHTIPVHLHDAIVIGCLASDNKNGPETQWEKRKNFAHSRQSMSSPPLPFLLAVASLVSLTPRSRT